MADTIFSTVKRTRTVDRVMEQIQDRILDGTFAPGEMLPSASDLASQFGVSQRSIGEALKVLEVKGLVGVQMGKGTTVTRNDLDAFLSALTRNLPSYLSTNKADLLEVKELRLIFESVALEHAINAQDQEQIAQLEQAVVEQRAAFERQDFAEYQRAHFKFHHLLMEGVNNRLIYMIYRQVLNLLREEMKEAGSRPHITIRAMAEHEEMIAAIRNHASPEDQTELLNRHLEGFVDHLER